MQSHIHPPEKVTKDYKPTSFKVFHIVHRVFHIPVEMVERAADIHIELT